MDFCEGLLLIPPDRSQILGRAVWKPRHVVVGKPNAHRQDQSHYGSAQSATPGRSNQSSGPKALSKLALPDEYFIFIYKARDDIDPSYMYPLSSVIDCQIQMVAHRKQGPVLPTLVISTSDKERKRRSSRATGLITTKEANSATLMFRTPPDDHHKSLQEWARFILSKKSPMSPDSPASPSFFNPFAPRSHTTDFLPRPTSGNANSRSAMLHKNSIASSSRDRPTTFSSESPSLRSKRSDISSPSSATHSSSAGYAMPDLNNYTTVLPTDIPSPVTTGSDFQQSEFIEGWTSAQGRSSAVSSPIRGRGSVSSGAQQVSGSSPPAPRETILDRAFQMRYIPGSETTIPGEEKLSSLARFDALMREADDKRHHHQKQVQAPRSATHSAWDNDDSSDDDDDDGAADAPVGGSDGSSKENVNRRTLIPPNAQRALDFLTGRHEQSQPAVKPPVARSPATFHAPSSTPSRPHTAHSKLRPSVAQRTHSQPQLVPQPPERLDVPFPPPGKISEDGSSQPSGEKRLSTSSAKRLSFNEFTRRLSSTSSLLLVQTNVSAGSSRGSSEFDRNPSPVPRGTLNARGAPPPRPRDADRCGWRPGPGFTEGGFL